MKLNPIRETALLAAALCAATAQAQSTLYNLPGSATGDRYGQTIRNAGDVDRDGIEDFIVGTKAAPTVKGYAEVVSGASGQILHTFTSTGLSDWYGTAVAGVGDLNADGYDELLVGAPLAGAGGSGRAYVFDGDTGGQVYNLAGVSSGDHFGWAVTGLGDVDGDLIPDFAVSAVDDDNQAASSGTVRVISGATGGELYTLEGTRSNELFGSALASMPDIDGDGASELIVGAPFVVNSTTEAGDAFVFSGTSGNLLLTFSGVNAKDAFGQAVGHAGDVNGDGVADIVVGAPQPTPGMRGWARVYSGAGGTVLLDWGGDSQGDLFGSAVASAGDLNGDTRSEVAVGAPGDDDLGSASGSVRVFDGASALTIFTHHGSMAGEELGASLDAAGDLNGDLASDLLASGPGMGAGSAQIISSVSLGMTGTDHILSAGGPGNVQLTVDFGASHAGRTYMVLGAITGISQGTSFGNLVLPVNRDRYFKKTYKLNPNSNIKPPTGNLDGAGMAMASFSTPGKSPIKWLVGQTFHHTAVVLDNQGNALEATNAWPITIVP